MDTRSVLRNRSEKERVGSENRSRKGVGSPDYPKGGSSKVRDK